MNKVRLQLAQYEGERVKRPLKVTLPPEPWDAEPPNQNNHLKLKEKKFSAPLNENSGVDINSQEDREGP